MATGSWLSKNPCFAFINGIASGFPCHRVCLAAQAFKQWLHVDYTAHFMLRGNQQVAQYFFIQQRHFYFGIITKYTVYGRFVLYQQHTTRSPDLLQSDIRIK